MRVGMDIRKYSDFGIGTYIRNLLTEYCKNENLDLTLFAADDQISELKGTMPAAFVAEKARKYSLQELISLSAKANKTNISLFHAPHYTLPINLKKRSVVTVHDLIHLKMGMYFSFAQIAYARAVIRHACKHSTHIITDSEFTKRDILTTFDVDEHKITAIPLGIHPAFLLEERHDEKDKFKSKYAIQKQYILYTGSFKPHKNIPLLLKAFKIVRKSIDVHLVFTGENLLDYKNLTGQINESGLTSYVINLGHLNHDELVQAYRASEAVVLPSLYEGFGFSMVEAMASGVPALGAQAASIPEVVGEGGMLFDPHDEHELANKIVQVLTDRTLRQEMIRKGRERAQLFKWDTCAQQTIEIYRKVIA